MRILFTFAGNWGHLDPLLPTARAAEAAGHTVAFSGRPWMVQKVVALGFACFPGGSDEGLVPQRMPLRPVDRQGDTPWGPGQARERLADLMPVGEAWRPDLIVWEETDLGGGLAAECLGIPHASVVVTASGSFLRAGVVGPALRELRLEQELAPDPDLEMLSRYLVLVPVPPSFRDPAFPLPATAHSIRPGALDSPRDESPAWVRDLPKRPTVYLTLGSVFPLESGDLFARAIAGVRELPITLIVSVGHEFDPAELGPQPSNVRVVRWVPQAALLSACDLVVCHGGSGTVIGALANGRPLVVIPMGADQPHNAERCAALGVGRILDPIAATSDDVRAAVQEVLANGSYRDAARRIERECAGLPDARHAVSLLERLAVERRPLHC